MIPNKFSERKMNSHNRVNYRPKHLEVWLVDIPFDGRDGSKVRPAIVIKESDGKYGVVMMTSSPPSSENDFILMDPESAGLEYGSTVKAGKIYYVTPSKFRTKKGTLSEYDKEELRIRMNYI